MIKYKSLSKVEAEEIYNIFIKDGYYKIVDTDYSFMRVDLLKTHKEILDSGVKNDSYSYDLEFGLFFYTYLAKNGFSQRVASNDGYWRFLSLRVIPDIVYCRWGEKEGRYWKESRRVWLKAIWWYIHLSWQGAEESTYEILKNNNTDIIVQLVERPGRGYRINFSRTFMREYYYTPQKYKKGNRDFFRRLMKLNTARTQVIEPLFAGEGEENYIWELIESIN